MAPDTKQGTTPRPNRLLIAVQRQELFQRFEIHLARDPGAGRNLRAQHCLPEQLDSHIREAETDAVIVIEPRFREGLPGSVRHWKAVRPDLQALFIFRRLPERRDLVELMRAGAFDVIDTEIEALGAPLIQQVLNDLARRLEEIQMGGLERDQARDKLARVGLIGESAEMQSLFVQAQQAAAQSSPVLISGEPGSGKRLLAHAIHAIGARSSAQLVTVDCLSLSPAILGASLFGAGPQSCGPMLWAAERGTLLLNEVCEMPQGVQAQFQKTLESPEATPDVRFISTTSRRMEQLVESRIFRQDLCYRLNVLSLEVPPLRRRLLDVPLLARYFLSRLEREGRALTLSEEAAGALNRHHWPGNVRELKEALASAAIRAVGDEILPSHLPGTVTRVERGAADEAHFSLSELNLERLERQAILRALQISGFDKARAARLLGIGKTTMYRKLKEMSGKPRA